MFQAGDGSWREVAVAQRRFTIGRDAHNDLVLDDARIARRHAVIENFDGGVLLYDCQSEHGTRLNNTPLGATGGALNSGDLITLGGACDLTVRLHTPAARLQAAPPPVAAHTPHEHVATSTSSPVGLSVGVRAAVAATIALVFVTIGLLMLARQQTPSRPRDNADTDTTRATPDATAISDPTTSDAGARPPVDATATSDDELERAATRVVQRASGDDKPYVFPPEALADIRRQVEELRQSAALRADLTAMQRGARDVAAQARGAGIEPELVIYAALARSEAGGDAAARARALVPQLQQLRSTFGSDADSSLLLIAAYTNGVGSRQSHPLLATIRRLVHNPFAERNVWYLRAHGGLSDAAYRFVIRFLAAGVIAQDPRRYGLPALAT